MPAERSMQDNNVVLMSKYKDSSIRYHTPSSSFARELERVPGGVSLSKCIQCGICTACCVVAHVSERYRPRMLIQKILLGERDEVLSSELSWLCMTCRMCECRCQEGVSPAEIFQAVRYIAAREGHIPSVFRNSVKTILQDGWMLESSYSDFIMDEREELGLDPELDWNSRFTRRLKEIYFPEV